MVHLHRQHFFVEIDPDSALTSTPASAPASATASAPAFNTFNRVWYFTYEQKTSLESLAREKSSSFLRTFVNDGHKKFYNIWPSLF